MAGQNEGLTLDFSKTQIDRLGERLKEGPLSEEDLRLLDEYRQSFGEAYETVFRMVSQVLQEPMLGVEPTGRAAKSTSSIIDKLRRESMRLTQMQDIAGCRAVVSNIQAQDWVVALLVRPRRKQSKAPILSDPSFSDPQNLADPARKCEGLVEEWNDPAFPDATVIDRRANPSYGYRAVHIIVKSAGKLVEIQIRSELQQLWAELSEKFSDVVGPSIKYGRGNELAQEFLALMSEGVMDIEDHEKQLSKVPKTYNQMWRLFPSLSWYDVEEKLSLEWQNTNQLKEKFAAVLKEILKMVAELECQKEPAEAKIAVGRSLGILLDIFPEWKKALPEEKTKKRQE